MQEETFEYYYVKYKKLLIRFRNRVKNIYKISTEEAQHIVTLGSYIAWQNYLKTKKRWSYSAYLRYSIMRAAHQCPDIIKMRGCDSIREEEDTKHYIDNTLEQVDFDKSTIMERLSEEEALFVKEYFYKNEKLHDISKKYDINPQRLGQIRDRALNKIRRLYGEN